MKRLLSTVAIGSPLAACANTPPPIRRHKLRRPARPAPHQRSSPKARVVLPPSPLGDRQISPLRRPTHWPPKRATRLQGRAGSAIDAAIAVQMVLTLVEPQSSGIGGGAFLLHSNAGKVEAFDGRETAPKIGQRKPLHRCRRQAHAVLRRRGRPLGRHARHGAHARDGAQAIRQLSWAKLFEPAIALADNGFKVTGC